MILPTTSSKFLLTTIICTSDSPGKATWYTRKKNINFRLSFLRFFYLQTCMLLTKTSMCNACCIISTPITSILWANDYLIFLYHWSTCNMLAKEIIYLCTKTISFHVWALTSEYNYCLPIKHPFLSFNSYCNTA